MSLCALLSLTPSAGIAHVHRHGRLFSASAADPNSGPLACAASVSPALFTAFNVKLYPLCSPFGSNKLLPKKYLTQEAACDSPSDWTNSFHFCFHGNRETVFMFQIRHVCELRAHYPAVPRAITHRCSNFILAICGFSFFPFIFEAPRKEAAS